MLHTRGRNKTIEFTNATQIFCVCIPWSSCHTCLGQTWWSKVSCHESQPVEQRATSKKAILHSSSSPISSLTLPADFMVCHEPLVLLQLMKLGYERVGMSLSSLAFIPDRGHRYGTTAWCMHHHMSNRSESSLHIYTEDENMVCSILTQGQLVTSLRKYSLCYKGFLAFKSKRSIQLSSNGIMLCWLLHNRN